MHGRDNLWQKALIGSLEGKRKIIEYKKSIVDRILKDIRNSRGNQ